MRNTQPVTIKHFRGVNLKADQTEIDDRQFRWMENAIQNPRWVLAKRPGIALYGGTAVMANAWNVFRFYPPGQPPVTVRSVNGGDGRVQGMDDSTAAVGGAASDLITGQTANNMHCFLQWHGRLYCPNGIEPMQYLDSSYLVSHSKPLNMTGLADANFGQFGIIYRDRFFSVRTPTQPTYAYFTDTGSDTVVSANSFLRFGDDNSDALTGVGLVSIQQDTSGATGNLLFFKRHAVWMLPGDPTVSGNAPVNLSDRIGCPAHLTIRQTPYGTIFMGTDNVYLVPFNGIPRPIGDDIQSEILAIGAAQKSRSCAIYDGTFYRLSYAGGGSGVNNRQLWLDLRDFNILAPDWYGPMTGQNVDAYAMALLEPDSGQIFAVDHIKGAFAQCAQYAIATATGFATSGQSAGKGFTTPASSPLSGYNDYTTAIVYDLITKSYDFGDQDRQKIFDAANVGQFVADTDPLAVTVIADDGQDTLAGTITPDLPAGSIFDTGKWDQSNWAGTVYQNKVFQPSRRVLGYLLGLELKHSTANNRPISEFSIHAKPIRRRFA